MNIRDNNKIYDVCLEDDGTLDTVLSVNGNEIRFSTEYASEFRDESGIMTTDGLNELAHEAIDVYEQGM